MRQQILQREDLAGSMAVFSKEFDPRRLLFANSQDSDLGVIYSAKSDELWIVDKDRLPSYDRVIMDKTKNGYLFSLADGCVVYAVEMITSQGKPYLIQFPE